jgi:hypothetical protein
MDFWLAVVIIVALTSATKMMKYRSSAPAQIEGPETAALVREVAALEERIRVLERIVTENRSSRDLAHEIESLRQ